jgi:hypothetical protein
MTVYEESNIRVKPKKEKAPKKPFGIDLSKFAPIKVTE